MSLTSEKLVHWPQGLPSKEADDSNSGTISAYARNRKTIVSLTDITGDATLNLASTFVGGPDLSPVTFDILREEGFEIVLKVVADGAHTLTLGTGFGAAASVATVNGTAVFKFEYIDGSYELVA